MKALAPEAKAILQLLVNRIREGRFLPDNAKSFMGYGEAHRELGLEVRGFHWGSSLRRQGLESLAVWIHENELPAITGLIVDQKDFRPGDGYFEVNGRPIGDSNWWSDQVRKAIAFDWSPYVEDDTTPSLDELERFTQAVVEGALSTIPAESALVARLSVSALASTTGALMASSAARFAGGTSQTAEFPAT